MKKETKKKIGSIIVAGTMLLGSNLVLSSNNYVKAQGINTNQNKEITVTYNGEKLEFDQEPIIEEGRTKVPFRKIFESMGTIVYYNNTESSILGLTKTGDIITHKIGTNKATINGEEKEYDSSSTIQNGRTLVPVRMISDLLGADVEWIEKDRTVEIEKEEEQIDSTRKDVMNHVLDVNYNPKDTNRYVEYKKKHPEISTEQAIIDVNIDLDREFVLYTENKEKTEDGGLNPLKGLKHYDSKVDEREEIDNPDDILAYVNNYNIVSKDYSPNDLVNISPPDRIEQSAIFSKIYLRAEAAEKYKEMVEDYVKSNNIDNEKKYQREIGFQYASNGYLSQKELDLNMFYKRYDAQFGSSAFPALPQNGMEEYAYTYYSEPEMSDQRLGYTVNLKIASTVLSYSYMKNHYGIYFDKMENVLNNPNQLVQNIMYKWAKDNSYKYGFILRYPESKQNITRKEYVPQQFRYVGVDIARQMHNEKICFDEYYAKYLNPIVAENKYSVDYENTQKVLKKY